MPRFRQSDDRFVAFEAWHAHYISPCAQASVQRLRVWRMADEAQYERFKKTAVVCLHKLWTYSQKVGDLQ